MSAMTTDVTAVLDRIRVLTHSSIRLETADGTVIYVDPYNVKGKPKDADIVLVTHGHFDHLSEEDIAKVAKASATLVAPATCKTQGDALGLAHAQYLMAGDCLDLGACSVEAVAAYNVAPERQGFHPKKNQWLGYVLSLDGARIYVAGDTDQNPENEQVICDIALIPVGGKYTMDAKQAAAFIDTIAPAVAIPTHYGSVAGTEEDGARFAALVSGPTRVLIKKEY